MASGGEEQMGGVVKEGWLQKRGKRFQSPHKQASLSMRVGGVGLTDAALQLVARIAADLIRRFNDLY